VDPDNDFQPVYEQIKGKEKVIKELKTAAKSADRILLAADPDREGEAICQHLKEILNGEKAEIYRVLFNEITPKAIKYAVENPGRINQKVVDAQQARRILDRLVGYQISPLLWDKVRRGISAGRVQTVALRLIVEREREIQAFKSEEYWSILARLEGHQPPPFDAKLSKINGKTAEVKNQEEADHILKNLEDAVPGSSIHHKQAAAGSGPQAALHGEENHDALAAPL
jgi:DNA topoisomerase-1